MNGNEKTIRNSGYMLFLCSKFGHDAKKKHHSRLKTPAGKQTAT